MGGLVVATLTSAPVEHRSALRGEKGLAMIISKYGKSYDTSNGSEQQFGRAQRRSPSADDAAKARWLDDGGAAVAAHPVVFAKKPAWSVLSLSDLNEAIRRSGDPTDAARAHQESQRLEDARLRAIALDDAKSAAAARSERNRYRNPWENT